MQILDRLNPQQLEAVKYNSGPLLVLAGAGSGKTTLLTVKYAYLIKELKFSPFNILAVTFTNKAANEMKERICKLTDFSGDIPWICTFHSFGVKILRRFIERLGYKINFVIYDDKDQKSFLKKIIKEELNFDEKNYSVNKVAYFINDCKNNGLAPDDVKLDETNPFYSNLKMIYEIYQEKMKKNNSVDFGDLLLLTYKLLKKDEEVLSYYQAIFKYILVDEYQDTNKVQYYLIKLLAEKHNNICVVGDDDQSIYGWRGADIGNILNFEKDFPNAKIIKLEQNYRSTANILNAANELISKNRRRKGKKLWTEKSKGEKIHLFEAENEYEEAKFVVNEIKKIKKYSQIAVLYRTNAQSRVFEDELVKNSIPYIIIGAFKFFERKEIKDLIAYLKIIDGSDDIINFERVINTPPRGIGKKTFEKIVKEAFSKNITFMEALKNFKKKNILDFYYLINKYQNLKDNIKTSDLLVNLINEIDYMAIFDNLTYVEKENKFQNIQELISSIKNFEDNYPDGNLTEYLDSISLTSSLDIENKEGSVTLMTIHSAKGLEFNYVFLCGFEDDLLPHINSKYNEIEIEEERRLCYVAITRAKNKLYISYARRRSSGRFSDLRKASPFLKDLPKNILEFREKEKIAKLKYSFENEVKQNVNPSFSKYKKGTIVFHKKFGHGIIIKIDGFGENAKVTVLFKKFGEKKLLISKAPLQIL